MRDITACLDCGLERTCLENVLYLAAAFSLLGLFSDLALKTEEEGAMTMDLVGLAAGEARGETRGEEKLLAVGRRVMEGKAEWW